MIRLTGPASRKWPARYSWTPDAASGTAIRASPQATFRSRALVFTTLLSRQKMASVLKYTSRRKDRLPPGQYDIGIVRTAHAARHAVATISGVNFIIGRPETNRSTRWAAIATAAVSRARRRGASAGTNVCGASIRTNVNAIRAQKGARLPALSGVTSATAAGKRAILTGAGFVLHHSIRPAEFIPSARKGVPRRRAPASRGRDGPTVPDRGDRA